MAVQLGQQIVSTPGTILSQEVHPVFSTAPVREIFNPYAVMEVFLVLDAGLSENRKKLAAPLGIVTGIGHS
jgi:hypothetical protein